MKLHKYIRPVFFWLLCGLFLCGPVAGQKPLLPPKPSFRSFNAASGLPSSETYETYQDKSGYLWIATDRGVARFDGYRFTVFTTNDGLTDNVVLSFYEDFKGRIWFLSLAGTLSYYENNKITQYPFNHIIRKRILGIRTGVKQIRVARDGTLTYSLRGIGGISISPNGTVEEKYPGNGRYVIEQIGTELNFYTRNDLSGTKSVKVRLNLLRNGKWSYPGELVAGLDTRLLLHQSQLFIIENRNINCVRNGKLKQLTNTGDAIGFYSDGSSLWIGYLQKGVIEYNYDYRTNTLHEVGRFFSGYSVSSINKDSEGGYWFTTLEAGVMYMPFPKVVHYTTQNGLVENFINSINGVGNNVFVLFGMGTIQQMNAPWTRFGRFFYTRSSIARFRDKLVISGHPGIEKVHPIFINLTHPDPYYSYLRAEEVFADQDHILSFCGGVLMTNARKKTSVLYSSIFYADEKVQQSFDALVMDDQQNVYGGNRYGLFRIGDNMAFAMDHRDTLFHLRVSDLAYDRNLGVITGTRGAGVYFFKNEKIYRNLTEKDGLLSNQINFLYLDASKRLWVGSNKGLTMVELKGERYTMRHFTTKNGLISNEINSVYVDETSKRIWVGTKAGISVLPLDLLPPKNNPSNLFLSGIRTLRGEQPLSRHFYEAGTSFMEITFRTTNFSAAPYHLFRYRLHPEDPWIAAWEPKITLNDPSPGDYALEVSYRDGNGTWIVSKTIYTFTINSPFWMKWYFITACFLVFSAIVFYLFRVRIRQINRRHYYETRINQLEQKALSAQMNPHFIFNSLNSIQSFLVYEENEKAERYLLKFSSLIRQTLANSRERYIRIEQEIKILKDYLELEQMRFRNKFTFEIQSRLSATELHYLIPPMLIQPYVENAILHGVALLENGGLIKIVFEVNESNHLVISIDDNGVGRHAAGKRKKTEHRSFGTTITQERLRFFNKDLGNHFRVEIIDKMKDDEPDGTRILLQLPIRTYYEPEDSDHY